MPCTGSITRSILDDKLVGHSVDGIDTLTERQKNIALPPSALPARSISSLSLQEWRFTGGVFDVRQSSRGKFFVSLKTGKSSAQRPREHATDDDLVGILRDTVDAMCKPKICARRSVRCYTQVESARARQASLRKKRSKAPLSQTRFVQKDELLFLPSKFYSSLFSSSLCVRQVYPEHGDSKQLLKTLQDHFTML